MVGLVSCVGYVLDQDLSNLDDCRGAYRPLPSGIGELSKAEFVPNCNRPIRSLLGGLLCFANVTRPEIAAFVTILSRFLEKPNELIWKSCCQILRYLVTTKNHGLKLGPPESPCTIPRIKPSVHNTLKS